MVFNSFPLFQKKPRSGNINLTKEGRNDTKMCQISSNYFSNTVFDFRIQNLIKNDTRMLKLCGEAIYRPLNIIFKTCLNTSKVPSEWKKGNS